MTPAVNNTKTGPSRPSAVSSHGRAISRLPGFPNEYIGPDGGARSPVPVGTSSTAFAALSAAEIEAALCSADRLCVESFGHLPSPV